MIFDTHKMISGSPNPKQKKRTASNKAAAVAKRCARDKKPKWHITIVTDAYFDVGKTDSYSASDEPSGSAPVGQLNTCDSAGDLSRKDNDSVVIKAAHAKLVIGGGQHPPFANSTHNEQATYRAVPAFKLNLVPAASDKGCNLEGFPDMLPAGQVSEHPEAAPSIFKAFVMLPQASIPSLYSEVANGEVHDVYSGLESGRLLNVSKYWGTFLTATGVKRKCDVPVSRDSNCGLFVPSEIENSFLAKRRKLYSTPASFRVNLNQFESDSVAFRSQRDSTVGTNAPTYG